MYLHLTRLCGRSPAIKHTSSRILSIKEKIFRNAICMHHFIIYYTAYQSEKGTLSSIKWGGVQNDSLHRSRKRIPFFTSVGFLVKLYGSLLIFMTFCFVQFVCFMLVRFVNLKSIRKYQLGKTSTKVNHQSTFMQKKKICLTKICTPIVSNYFWSNN